MSANLLFKLFEQIRHRKKILSGLFMVGHEQALSQNPEVTIEKERWKPRRRVNCNKNC